MAARSPFFSSAGAGSPCRGPHLVGQDVGQGWSCPGRAAEEQHVVDDLAPFFCSLQRYSRRVFTFSWPMYSPSRWGRRENSKALVLLAGVQVGLRWNSMLFIPPRRALDVQSRPIRESFRPYTGPQDPHGRPIEPTRQDGRPR